MSSESRTSTGLYDVWAWAEENRRNVLVGFVALLVVAAALTVYLWRRGQTEIAANTALLQLRVPADAAATSTGPTASEYLSVIDRYRGTEAAERALLLAAGALFTEGKYADARSRFEQFLNGNRNHELAPIAAYGVASSLDAEGKQDEALSAYQRVLSAHSNSSVADDSKLAIARIHMAKDQPQQALKAIEDLTSPTRAAGPDAQAVALKDEILAKHPELAPAPTNAVPAVTLTNAAPAAAPTGAPSGLGAEQPGATSEQPK